MTDPRARCSPSQNSPVIERIDSGLTSQVTSPRAQNRQGEPVRRLAQLGEQQLVWRRMRSLVSRTTPCAFSAFTA